MVPRRRPCLRHFYIPCMGLMLFNAYTVRTSVRVVAPYKKGSSIFNFSYMKIFTATDYFLVNLVQYLMSITNSNFPVTWERLRITIFYYKQQTVSSLENSLLSFSFLPLKESEVMITLSLSTVFPSKYQ
jgi:hypothetical protein